MTFASQDIFRKALKAFVRAEFYKNSKCVQNTPRILLFIFILSVSHCSLFCGSKIYMHSDTNTLNNSCSSVSISFFVHGRETTAGYIKSVGRRFEFLNFNIRVCTQQRGLKKSIATNIWRIVPFSRDNRWQDNYWRLKKLKGIFYPFLRLFKKKTFQRECFIEWKTQGRRIRVKSREYKVPSIFQPFTVYPQIAPNSLFSSYSQRISSIIFVFFYGRAWSEKETTLASFLNAFFWWIVFRDIECIR